MVLLIEVIDEDSVFDHSKRLVEIICNLNGAFLWIMGPLTVAHNHFVFCIVA
jgi:hypothetical protein